MAVTRYLLDTNHAARLLDDRAPLVSASVREHRRPLARRRRSSAFLSLRNPGRGREPHAARKESLVVTHFEARVD